MKKVRFDKSGAEPVFRFINTDGNEDRIEYHPSIDGLWKDIDTRDFSVDLLINPILNRASNIFNIRRDDESNERVGMIFPVTALDTNDSFEQTGMCNYAFVAFHTLLERLQEIEDSDADFSENFEENICVCVFNLKTVGIENPLHLCMNSLRKYGYSYFEKNNKIEPVAGYKADKYVPIGVGNIEVKFEEPKLYSNPIIEMLMRELPYAHNVIHRFVLLYQVIEILMEAIALRKINEEIDKLKRKEIPHNDFLDNLKNIGTEKARIVEIFNICSLTANEFSCFKDPCQNLYTLAGYVPDNDSEKPLLFYSFRNVMTHSFRALRAYPVEVAETVQGFERVILTIMEKYK